MPTEKKLTGYPSIDKPWLKYYTEEAIKAKLPECNIYEYLWENNKKHLEDIAITYFYKNISYRELFENIDKIADSFISSGVKKGDVVATTGNTGWSTGIHCHYEIQLNGEYQNPRDYL